MCLKTVGIWKVARSHRRRISRKVASVVQYLWMGKIMTEIRM